MCKKISLKFDVEVLEPRCVVFFWNRYFQEKCIKPSVIRPNVVNNSYILRVIFSNST